MQAVRMNPFNKKTHLAIILAGTTVILAFLGGWLSFMQLSGEAHRQIEITLDAIVDMKLAELSTWLMERRKDTLYNAGNPVLYSTLIRWLENKNPADLAVLSGTLKALIKNYGYASAALLGADGNALLIEGELVLDVDTQNWVVKKLQQGAESVFVDLHHNTMKNTVIMGLAAPVLSNDSSIKAIIILTIDPDIYLYSSISHWPLQKPSGQIILARQEKDELVLLSSTGFGKNLLSLGFPVDNIDTGFKNQADFDGMSMLYSARPVPETPWVLLATEAREEIEHENQRLALQIWVITLLITVALLTFLYVFWRRHLWLSERRELAQELALRQANGYFRGTFEQAAVGIAHTDLEGRIQQINRKLCDFLGHEPDILTGTTFKSLYLAESRLSNMDYLKLLIEGKINKFEMDKPYLRQQEKILWFHITISLFSNSDGTPGYFIWVFEDMTQRHHAEQSLIASESVYKALFEHSPIALIESDYSIAMRVISELEGRGIPDIQVYLLENPDRLRNMAALVRITNLNQGAARLLELLPDQAMPNSLSEYFNTESFEVFVRELDGLMSARSIVQEEMPLVTTTGRQIWITTHLAILPGHDSDYQRVLVSLIDITERKQMESKLLSMNAELESRVDSRTAELMSKTLELQDTYAEQQAIFESVSSGICLLKDRIIVRYNKRLAEIYGYNPDEILNKPVSDFYPDSNTYLSAVDYYEYIEDGMTVRFDLPQVRKDGSPLYCRVSGRLLDIAAPDKGSVWVMDDITQEHKMTEDLVVAKNTAETANQSKSTFLANMSHELRTPLNAIIGYTHLLHQDSSDWRQKDHLQRISDAAQHLYDIINDILDLSKIEAGKFTLESAELRLDDILEKVYNLVVEKADTKGLEIVSDIDPRLSSVFLGDALRLGQVLLNLLSNAVKFTETGLIKVTAQFMSEDAGGVVTIRFEVWDTGVGIDNDAQSRLFRPFEQADDSITRQFGGTGLGLAICHRLVQMMGGAIGLASVLGEGSSFWFTLPMQRCGAVKVPEWLRRRQDRLRGLVVDDQPAVSEVLVKMLNYLEIEVDAVESGQMALARIVEANAGGKAYDFVIIDCKMPGMTGIEVSTQMRALTLEKNPACLMMLSPVSQCSQSVNWFEQGNGNDCYLPKPVTLTSLQGCLSRVLNPWIAPDETEMASKHHATSTAWETQEHEASHQDFLQVKPVVDELQSLLAENNIHAIKMFQEHEKALSDLLGEQATEFGYLMKKFEFDHALTLLQSVCEKYRES